MPATGGVGNVRFWSASGGRCRVEDDEGLLRVCDGIGTAVRQEGGLWFAEQVVIGVGPERLLRPVLPQVDDASRLRHGFPPVTVEAAGYEGRPAWRLGEWLLDDRSGAAVRQDQESGWMALTGLVWDERVDDDLFVVPDAPTWVAPPDPDHPEWDPEAWGDRPVPTLRWTPNGLWHTHLDGDVETGWLVQELRLLDPGGCTDLVLHRRPDGADAPLPVTGYRWHADGCDWALEPQGGGAAVDLAVLAASVDTDTPWPRR